MTRIRKKNVPYPKIRVNSKCVVAAASLLSFVAILCLYYASRSLVVDGDASNQPEYIGDFNQVRPGYGKLSPITWREDGSYVAPNAYRIFLPSQLTIAMKAFCDRIGLTDLARNFIISEENNIEPDGYRLFDLGGITWFAQRPASTWSSDMHWISPANERGHEEYLALLRENGFLSVLNSIGHQLDLDGLAAYHLTFIVVSHCEMGFVHHDTTETGNKVFNVIIPLESVPNSPPELIITDSRDDSVGRLKYEDNIGVLIGDDVHHATSECDYRDNPGTMRLAATIYVADINEENAETIALTTLTQAFPPPDKNWVFAQRARHWINAKNRDDVNLRNGEEHFVGDRGRADFDAVDLEENNCHRIQEEVNECSRLEARRECAWTCGIYLKSSFYEGFDGTAMIN